MHVVHALARAQDGSVSYEPGRYGGSVFTISLAAFPAPPDEPPAEGAGGPAA